jgi:hypothetical protein
MSLLPITQNSVKDMKMAAFALRDLIIWAKQIASGMEYLSSKHVNKRYFSSEC